MREDPDAADVEAVLAGNVERFAAIVERWQETLVNLAYCFTRDASLAEDLAQEAFLQCFRRLAQWRREAPFRTWIYSLALNVYRSQLRRWRLPLEPLSDTLAGPSSLAAELLEAERQERVRRELGRLPPVYREALALFYLEEQDLAATASALGVPVGTLKARLHRGRELLRRRLRRIFG